MKNEAVEWGKTIAMVLALFLGIQTVAFASFHIPSESMAPTLAVGDRVLVTKYAYGYSKNSIAFNLGGFLPETKGRLFQRTPKRGDIVVFKHTQDSKTMIKRVIALPGERVSMKNGRLYINREAVPITEIRDYTFTSRQGRQAAVREYKETLPGGVPHDILEIRSNGPFDNMAEIVVPKGHLFMMGDNRDMSSDSRNRSGLSTVPITNLMGKAVIITYSLKNCGKRNPDICDSSRLLKRLYQKPDQELEKA